MNRISNLILTLALILFAFSTLQAQRGGRGMDPETSANRTTTIMTDSLALSEAQTEKIATVNLTYAKKSAELRKKMREEQDGDWETMREKMRTAMQTLRVEKNTALKKYMTADQFAKWEQVEADFRNKRRGEGRRGKGKGKGRKGGKGKKQMKETEEEKTH